MAARPEPAPATPERAGTMIETDEDIRRALIATTKGAAAPSLSPAPPPPSHGPPASPYRPRVRPPIPILTVCDDGKAEGESIRIRGPRFVIGRTEGDLTIPLDARISARHVEITHQLVGGTHRWVVTDLQSTHGMFVRVSRTALADGAELLVGGGRYRFDAMQADAGATRDYEANNPASGQTRGWDDAVPFRPAAITELIGAEVGNRLLLVKPEYWIGSDPSCAICRGDDPFCEPRHARLFRGAKGAWGVEHDRTLNGLWMRMAQITAEGVVHFQAGEQRFRLKVS